MAAGHRPPARVVDPDTNDHHRGRWLEFALNAGHEVPARIAADAVNRDRTRRKFAGQPLGPTAVARANAFDKTVAGDYYSTCFWSRHLDPFQRMRSDPPIARSR